MVILNLIQPLAKNTDLWLAATEMLTVLLLIKWLKSQIEAYNSDHKYDFICISETYLDSSVSDDDKELDMEGYNFIRAEHPSNVKKGGVGIYF